jgi:hypothetical protein
MDQKAQISVELILFAGLILVVVLVFATVVSNQSELNTVATAVRIGADNGTTQLSILNSTMHPVRVTKTYMNYTTYGINITLSDTITSTQSSTLMTSVMNSMNAQGYTVSGNTVTTSKHVYTIVINASDIS